MKNIDLVIFDMDGLMFDTEKISFAAWRQAAAKYGYIVGEEILRETLGTNLENTKEVYLKYFGGTFPFEKVAEERFRIAEEIIELRGVPIKDGLYGILDYLQKLDVKKAVATSTSRKRALKLIRMAGIENCFNYIICGDEVEKCKPDPDIFLKAADKLGCLPERCIVLEDSEVGVQAAYRTGMLPIMIPDVKEPGKEILELVHRRVNSLHEAKEVIGESCGI